MLTFTEFFTKKKIDIQAIKNAKPELYQEFERDYDQMGEKSFDHSKKFWFNRLRHQFLLETIEMPKPSQSEAQREQSPTNEKAIGKPTGFRPKFKASSQHVPAESKDGQDNADLDRPIEEKKKVPGFKPRFKSATPLQQNNDDTGTNSGDSTASQKAATSAEPTGSKPARTPQGFTPRFKAKQQTGELSDAGKDSGSEPPVERTEDTPVRSKPTGFKPRFKAGVTKPAPSAEPDDENKRLEHSTDASSETTENDTVNMPKDFIPGSKTETVTASFNSDNQQEDVPSGNQPVGFKVKFKKQASLDEQSFKTEETEDQPPAVSKEQGEKSELANDTKQDLEKKSLGFKPRMLRQKKNSANDSSDNS